MAIVAVVDHFKPMLGKIESWLHCDPLSLGSLIGPEL